MTEQVFVEKAGTVAVKDIAREARLQARAHELVEDTIGVARDVIDVNGLASYAGFTEWENKTLNAKFISLFKHSLAREILSMRVKAVNAQRDSLVRRISFKKPLVLEKPAFSRALEMQTESVQNQRMNIEAEDRIINGISSAARVVVNLLGEKGLINKNGDVVPTLLQLDGRAIGSWQDICGLPMPQPVASE
jgi:hypothetical protein